MALTFNQLPGNYVLRFVRGNDVKTPFQILTPVTANNITTNIPVNITGYSFKTGIYDKYRIFSGNIDVISNANGTIVANFTDSVTSNITSDCNRWFLDMTDTANYTQTLIDDCVEVHICRPQSS